jgi:hypothetical protein
VLVISAIQEAIGSQSQDHSPRLDPGKNSRPYLKNLGKKKMAPVVEHLSRKDEVLSSNCSTTKKNVFVASQGLHHTNNSSHSALGKPGERTPASAVLDSSPPGQADFLSRGLLGSCTDLHPLPVYLAPTAQISLLSSVLVTDRRPQLPTSSL